MILLTWGLLILCGLTATALLAKLSFTSPAIHWTTRSLFASIAAFCGTGTLAALNSGLLPHLYSI